MAVRPFYLVAIFLVAVAAVLGAYAWYLINLEQEPDPFSMTLLVSSSDANGTDENLTDVILWVAVAQGEPKPLWSEVEVMLESALGNETLSPPKLEISDQDDNGRVTQGDLLRLYGLTPIEMQGRVTLWTDGRAIGMVEL
jgi:hypothetical protein